MDFFWAFFILSGSLVSDCATLLGAVNKIKRSAKLKGIKYYVVKGKDPNVVLTEDVAAVTSVACMSLSTLTASPVYDAVVFLLVGGISGAVASFIIHTNMTALVKRSISKDQLDRINAELESNGIIRAIHDGKGIDIANYFFSKTLQTRKNKSGKELRMKVLKLLTIFNLSHF